MTTSFGALYLYTMVAIVSTVVGGMLPLALGKHITQKQLYRLLAFGSGLLLGAVFMHILPEAFKGSAILAGTSGLGAFLVILGIESFVTVHPCAEILKGCEVHTFGIVAGTVFFLHSFVDGMAMSAAFIYSSVLGSVVSLAVILHKFADGLMLSSILLATKRTNGVIAMIIVLLGLFTPLGALTGAFVFRGISVKIMAILLGATAGGFIYIGVTDILPKFHNVRDRVCWLMFLFGIAVMCLIDKI